MERCCAYHILTVGHRLCAGYAFNPRRAINEHGYGLNQKAEASKASCLEKPNHIMRPVLWGCEDKA
jgi:hypothetical protein